MMIVSDLIRMLELVDGEWDVVLFDHDGEEYEVTGLNPDYEACSVMVDYV